MTRYLLRKQIVKIVRRVAGLHAHILRAAPICLALPFGRAAPAATPSGTPATSLRQPRDRFFCFEAGHGRRATAVIRRTCRLRRPLAPASRGELSGQLAHAGEAVCQLCDGIDGCAGWAAHRDRERLKVPHSVPSVAGRVARALSKFDACGEPIARGGLKAMPDRSQNAGSTGRRRDR